MDHLLDLYREMEPVEVFMAALRASDAYLSIDFQDAVVAEIFRDPICDDYAPKQAYTYRIIKMYVHDAEMAGGDISDELMAELMARISNNKSFNNLDELHHVSYRLRLPNAARNDVITCRVATAHNEVGMKLWEAGFYLAEYGLAHPAAFANKRVIELGAGAGFTGLVLAANAAPPAHVLVTDYAPVVLQNLRYNVELNAFRGMLSRCLVTTAALDWTNWNWADCETAYDVLIAGDCVYDVRTFPDLMRVLAAFLARPRTTAIFASTIRNASTFQAFLDQLHAHAIDYVELPCDFPALFTYANRDSIRLTELRARD
ncbi:hypothetical protein SPRG_09775 [Saprolegnia parasitica CBS 223.65]|uniref:FAM86 N-terminal domain-containing protein n=1 Tax=Saprolegnia parasitica (strain CBS 223.65) TaxID=695850 RepID=A0A067CER4_SAPPC|nr:hypothetical protein SPRG_09775 [Saprolegnia parasitica CBS 223.65]KDO25046.1 hypothetical protein SPRG_09775 [Saprolegnia parasitica CBS 223.65]|eukprot:XP_012204314.1 hypothetical protein SPRG_09775 [Saprolegnia parasitica CBS 223.65]